LASRASSHAIRPTNPIQRFCWIHLANVAPAKLATPTIKLLFLFWLALAFLYI
jgi:hypothetical protein